MPSLHEVTHIQKHLASQDEQIITILALVRALAGGGPAPDH